MATWKVADRGRPPIGCILMRGGVRDIERGISRGGERKGHLLIGYYMYRREGSDNRMLSRLPELCPPGRGKPMGDRKKEDDNA